MQNHLLNYIPYALQLSPPQYSNAYIYFLYNEYNAFIFKNCFTMNVYMKNYC